MRFAPKFNGKDLSKYISVTSDFERGVGTGRVNNTLKIGNANFQKYKSYRLESKTISMPFKMINDLASKRRELAQILNTSEPAPLIFPDEPNVYYLAVVDGEIDLSEQNFLGTGTINWLIPDGVAHSLVEKEFSPTVNSEGVLEMIVKNEGSADTPISFELENMSDNGYFGIVSELGVMQFGNIEEVDGTDNYDASEVLVAMDPSKNDWEKYLSNIGGINYENTNKKSTKKAKTGKDSYGGTYVTIDASGTVPTNVYCDGVLINIDLPQDSKGKIGAKNFYIWFKEWFETGTMGESGNASITILDANNKFICCYMLDKTDKTGNTAHVQMYVLQGGKKVRYKLFEFQPTHWEKHNPYSPVNGGGPADIRKEGERVTMFYGGHYHSIVSSDIAELEAAKIQVYFGQYAGRNYSNQIVDHMKLRNFSFRKTNVSNWRDEPNKFAKGDILFVDGNKKKVYINDMLALDTEVRGTTYFEVPPGETKIQFYVSSFAQPPIIKATIREAWL